MFKILIVEDDRDLNRSVCSFLNGSGYEAILRLLEQERIRQIKKRSEREDR